MTRLILKRLGIGIVTVLAVSVIIFFGTKILPGDAAQIRLGQSATPENVAAFRERLGLDQPYIVQYMSWLKNFMTGDLGNSLASDVPIVDLIADRYKNTVFVSLLTAAIGVPISLALGILAAMYPGTFYDRVLTFVSVSLVAAPEFFTATLLVLFFVFVLDVGNAIVVTIVLAFVEEAVAVTIGCARGDLVCIRNAIVVAVQVSCRGADGCNQQAVDCSGSEESNRQVCGYRG